MKLKINIKVDTYIARSNELENMKKLFRMQPRAIKRWKCRREVNMHMEEWYDVTYCQLDFWKEIGDNGEEIILKGIMF